MFRNEGRMNRLCSDLQVPSKRIVDVSLVTWGDDHVVFLLLLSGHLLFGWLRQIIL